MSKQTEFIAGIAPIAREQYLSRSKWVLPSVCVAQAAIESGWNLKAKTLFGIKGEGITAKTKEYIAGQCYDMIASFKKYPTITAAVIGYYDLITGNSRYSTAVNNTDYVSTAYAIKAAGYATDPDYANKIVRIIQAYNLYKYDTRTTGIAVDGIMGTATTKATQKYFGTVQDGVISGQYKANIARCSGITTMKAGRKGSAMVRALQRWLGVADDGHLGEKTIKAWQRKMGTTVDGTISKPSQLIKAWQAYLNGVL